MAGFLVDNLVGTKSQFGSGKAKPKVKAKSNPNKQNKVVPPSEPQASVAGKNSQADGGGLFGFFGDAVGAIGSAFDDSEFSWEVAPTGAATVSSNVISKSNFDGGFGIVGMV